MNVSHNCGNFRQFPILDLIQTTLPSIMLGIEHHQRRQTWPAAHQPHVDIVTMVGACQDRASVDAVVGVGWVEDEGARSVVLQTEIQAQDEGRDCTGQVLLYLCIYKEGKRKG